jgi:hypothetical protein
MNGGSGELSPGRGDAERPQYVKLGPAHALEDTAGAYKPERGSSAWLRRAPSGVGLVEAANLDLDLAAS